MRLNHVMSVVCLLAAVGTAYAESTPRPEPLEYHAVPDWAKAPLDSAFTAESEATLYSDVSAPEKEPLPAEVAASIHKIVQDGYHGYIEIVKEHGGRYLPMAALYGPVFRLKAPNALNLYVFTLYPLGHHVTWGEWYYFLLFDPGSRKVTRNPFSMPTSFKQSSLFCEPLVHFLDVNLDGRPELVIERTARNGTMYDAAIYHYFHVTEDMDLKLLMALEARVVDLFSGESGLVVRTFECLGKNRIKIDVHLQDPAGTPHHPRVGTAILEAKDRTSAFQVVEKNIRAARYAGALLTASGMDEQSFLSAGYGTRQDRDRD